MGKKLNLQFKWIIKTMLLTFILAVIFSLISEAVIPQVHFVLAVILLLLIVFIGVFFDAIGIAVASASEKPFHAMAAMKVPHAKFSLYMLKNATQVANFCNDVVGDIAGIISGTTIGIVITVLAQSHLGSQYQAAIAVIFSGTVAALTVGGKAIGKEVAIKKSKEVISAVGYFLYLVSKLPLLHRWILGKMRKE